jgi:selenocysteine lyase/cysteine desulfurase
MSAVRSYEQELSTTLLDGLAALRGVRVHGITARGALDRRVPTVSITVDGKAPVEVARGLAERGVFATNGTGYAVSVIDRLGLTDRGGVVRLGAVHYNSREEIAAAVQALEQTVR